jgi:hypothetical protein
LLLVIFDGFHTIVAMIPLSPDRFLTTNHPVAREFEKDQAERAPLVFPLLAALLRTNTSDTDLESSRAVGKFV